MRFKHIAIGYAALWMVVIVVVCIWEWNALKKFQFSYMEENAKDGILADMRDSEKQGQTIGEDSANGAGNQGTEVYNNTAGQNQTMAVELQTFEIIADSSMKIMVSGVEQQSEVKEFLEDEIYSDYSQLTGTGISKNVYEVEAEDRAEISVTDASGNEIEPVENDYVAGSYYYDDELATAAIAKFEPYLKHISGMVSFSDLTAVMRNDSKAYKAVRNSQQSLEWMIKAKSMEFTKEEVVDMQIFDENHFACDVNIDLVKVANTEREHTVEESVKYRVLYENIDGQWYIYSFVTK